MRHSDIAGNEQDGAPRKRGRKPQPKRPNVALARLMSELGISNSGLAHRMCVLSSQDGGDPVAPKHTTIARYLSGAISRPSERGIEVLTAVLSEVAARHVSPSEAGYADPIDGSGGLESLVGLAPLDSRLNTQPLVAVDPALIEHLKVTLAEHVRLDALMGPQYVLPTLGGQLDMVENLCGKARGQTRDSLLEVGARFCEFAGWLYQDAGNLEKAMHWTNHAMDYAEELGDILLTSYVLQRKSNISTEGGYAAQGLGLANAALRRWDSLTPELRAVALRQRANAYAMTGEVDDCRRALDDAMSEVLSITELTSDSLALYCTPSYIEMEAAHSWVRLGKPERAIETYRVGLEDWPDAQRRDKGLCTARLSSAYLGAGMHHEAAEVGVKAAALAKHSPSARSFAVLRGIARRHSCSKHDVCTELGAAVAGI